MKAIRFMLAGVCYAILAAVMICLSIAWALAFIACSLAAGIAFAFSATAGLMWILAGLPATWIDMKDGLMFGLVFGSIAVVMRLVSGMAMLREDHTDPKLYRLRPGRN